jgi:hypothetical protein
MTTATQSAHTDAALLDLEMVSLGGSPAELLDAVQRNVAQAAELLGALTEVAFRCGCQLTLAGGRETSAHWRIMAWSDARCGSSSHGALKAKWEGRNL